MTPAPVPSSTPNDGTDVWTAGETGQPLAPGLTARGVTDPSALAAAHAAAVGNISHLLYARLTVRTPDGAVRADLVRRTAVGPLADADGDGYLTYVTTRGRTDALGARTTNVTAWSDGDRLVERVRGEDRDAFRHVPPGRYGHGSARAWAPRGPAPWHPPRSLFVSLAFEVVARETGNGPTRYRLASTGVRDATAFAAAAPVTDPYDVTARATVDETGFVRSYRLAYEGRFLGRAAVVTRVVDYSQVGEMAVPRPWWYDWAIEGTPTDRNASDTRTESGTLTGPGTVTTATSAA